MKRTGYIDSKRIAGETYLKGTMLTGTHQYYDEQSATQNYSLGSAMLVGERAFHYAQAAAALVAPCTYRLQTNFDLNATTTWGLVITNPQPVQPNGTASATGVTIGNTVLRVTHGNYGIVATTVAANELAGGWVEIWGAANAFEWRQILSNTASVAGAPAYIDLTLDRPITFAIAAAAGSAALHRSTYKRVIMCGSNAGTIGYESAVGLTPIPVTSGNYFWIQTFGPCLIAAQIGQPGAVINFRDCYLGTAGTLAPAGGADGATVSRQRVGYIIGASTTGDGNDDVMLQLQPY